MMEGNAAKKSSHHLFSLCSDLLCSGSQTYTNADSLNCADLWQSWVCLNLFSC